MMLSNLTGRNDTSASGSTAYFGQLCRLDCEQGHAFPSRLSPLAPALTLSVFADTVTVSYLSISRNVYICWHHSHTCIRFSLDTGVQPRKQIDIGLLVRTAVFEGVFFLQGAAAVVDCVFFGVTHDDDLRVESFLAFFDEHR
jgi:hypothetical protein